MGQFMHFDGVKPCILKILHRHLLAPHCAEAIAALRQRHRHAVHARNRVKQGTNRVLPVVLDVARGFDVLRQVDSVLGQRDPNAAQDISRAGLVVNGIEGGDEVKSAWLGLLVETAEVASDEAHVLVAPLFGLDAREFDSLFREIDSDEPAIREPSSQQVERPAPPAADVEDAGRPVAADMMTRIWSSSAASSRKPLAISLASAPSNHRCEKQMAIVAVDVAGPKGAGRIKG